MTITTVPIIKDGRFTVGGKVLLTGVSANVTLSPASYSTGSAAAFLGATSTTKSSRHVFTLGFLEGYRFLCLFRFKIWWMIPRFGKCGSDVPVETQMLLLEVREDSALHDGTFGSNAENTFYTLLLPLLDGDFRTSLQGSSKNELRFCVESGDANVRCSQALESVFVNSGANPFLLINESVKILEKHMGSFSHVEHKKIPAHLDWFGWCTWDAFYTSVNPQGIKDGLESLSSGGCPPRFLIIDDGWQDTVNEFQEDGKPLLEGTQFATRLADIKENKKFKDIDIDLPIGCGSCDLGRFIKAVKKKYDLKYVYVWHALVGYWGGVIPTAEAWKRYKPKLVYPIQSPGNLANIRDIAMDSLEKYGVGIIDPSKIHDFYNDLHSYLSSRGVDGVKVDVQNVLETLGYGYGGRVALSRQYQQALEESIETNFKDNHLICCMCHNTEYIFHSKKSAVARASEDFMPREETFQTLHIATVAFNSLLLGEFVVPDWDMFHSKHLTAEFHGAARAVGGCGVYVSDKPGTHDFDILKKLVQPDGSVLRANCAGRPTKDCLFKDPVMDGESLLKIWNLNKFSGVLGVFNCQGAGCWPCLKEDTSTCPTSMSNQTSSISGHVSPIDVEFLEELAGENWTGDCAVYAFNSKSLHRVPKNESVAVSLASLQCEIYTISPIREYNGTVQFAPIGLIEMYNSGGAIEALDCSMNDSSSCVLKIKLRGCGLFGAYSIAKPKFCSVEAKEEELNYSAKDKLLTVLMLPRHVQGETTLREIEFVY